MNAVLLGVLNVLPPSPAPLAPLLAPPLTAAEYRAEHREVSGVELPRHFSLLRASLRVAPSRTRPHRTAPSRSQPQGLILVVQERNRLNRRVQGGSSLTGATDRRPATGARRQVPSERCRGTRGAPTAWEAIRTTRRP